MQAPMAMPNVKPLDDPMWLANELLLPGLPHMLPAVAGDAYSVILMDLNLSKPRETNTVLL